MEQRRHLWKEGNLLQNNVNSNETLFPQHSKITNVSDLEKYSFSMS